MSHQSHHAQSSLPMVPAPASVRRAERVLHVVGLAALLVCLGLAAASTEGPRRLSHAWLLAAWYPLSISLGAMFFVAIQHLVRAGWSVTLRRYAEVIGGAVSVPALMLIPLVAALLVGSHLLFPWNNAAEVAGDKILKGKSSYLNGPFFSVRFVACAAVWIFCGMWLLNTSRRQDRTKDGWLTLLLERRSAVILIALGVSITVASFDWLMSLDPHWFSTIFGIYLFSGAFVAALAVLCVIASIHLLGRTSGKLITVEHLHDVSKLLFGMNCFWAYIAFSQYLLIWYANIPEETVWLRHRQTGGWETVSFVLAVGHFVVPFLLLMPRAAKRNPQIVLAGAVLILAMHAVDLYWLIYPQLSAAPVFGLLELTAMTSALAFCAFAVVRLAGLSASVPVGDPRLPEAVSHAVH